jgi:hypothetical protein
MKTTRRVICWKCEEDFRVELEDVTTPRVVVVRGSGESRTQKPKQKYIVKCPNPVCKADNEVRL